jgi:CRISPR-associated exonuclease Cas4
VNFLPLSFISEYQYCPRSAYHLLTDAPKLRDENNYIQSGRQAHEKVDEGYKASKSLKKIETSVRVFSKEFHISGKTDILEFYPNGEIIPVELKRGKTRYNSMHEMQLTLMALCLQEMFPENKIEKAGIFFTQDRQKKELIFTPDLFLKAKNLAKEVFEKTTSGLDPSSFPRMKDERCQGCCFYDLCYLE